MKATYLTPDFRYEKNLWKRGYDLVAGLDEVGRGCFAGPVVASAVALAPMTNFQLPIYNENNQEIFINDSKKLTPKRRRMASGWIKGNALAWGIGEASVSEINRLGMGKATNVAFRRAVASASRFLQKTVEFLLIDAFYLPYTRGLPKNSCQQAIPKGDSKSFSIAAASIIAKVYRDELMEKVGSRAPYKKYFWIENKGYGTKAHREAIIKYGLCCHHRKAFVKTFLSRG